MQVEPERGKGFRLWDWVDGLNSRAYWLLIVVICFFVILVGVAIREYVLSHEGRVYVEEPE